MEGGRGREWRAGGWQLGGAQAHSSIIEGSAYVAYSGCVTGVPARRKPSAN
jgi:hypothetical protein